MCNNNLNGVYIKYSSFFRVFLFGVSLFSCEEFIFFACFVYAYSILKGLFKISSHL